MIRVLVADPDRASRDRVMQSVTSTAGLRLSDVAVTLSEAYHACEHRRPDIAVISARFVLAPEFEVMALLFKALSVSAFVPVDAAGAGHVIETASRRHGLCLVPMADLGPALIARHLPGKPSQPPARPGQLHRTGAGSPGATSSFLPGHIILIGASTGGVDALLTVLGDFPAACPPTLIVQHTGASFSAGLARLLDSHTAPDVREARDGAVLQPGQVLIAPGSECHLTVEARAGTLTSRLVSAPPASGHRPSVDCLFRSAVPLGRRVAAALLTGMGRDGAEGLLALRQAGAATIGQDSATSVVYGMPRVAQEIGAVSRQMALKAIGPALLRHCMEETKV
ncbi:MAG: chemotaxis protein CheB [Rhodobacteraceae bacterium]|nr:MAG: chemotaxis protein CheB [Paracoccaceae bacterium]